MCVCEATNARRRDLWAFEPLDPELTYTVRWYQLCEGTEYVRSFVPGYQVVRPYTWSDEAGVEFWPLGRKRRHPSEAREEPDEALLLTSL